MAGRRQNLDVLRTLPAEELLAAKPDCLPGISTQASRLLRKLDIHSCQDLLEYFPRAYEAWSSTDLGSLQAGEKVSFEAELLQPPVLRWHNRVNSISAVLGDGRHSLRAIWFNQPYLKNRLVVGARYRFQGLLKATGYGLQIQNPRICKIVEAQQDQEGASQSAASLQRQELGGETVEAELEAVYPLTQGLRQVQLRRAIHTLLELLSGRIEENLPAELIAREGLWPREQALWAIHRPRSEEEQRQARRRLAYEELFFLQLGLRLMRNLRKRSRAPRLALSSEALEKYRAAVADLPFPLTRAQKRVLNELYSDLAHEEPMNRLVQGDVGSGKTAVAALAMYQAVLAGGQAAFMAPTSILAAQHARSLQDLLGDRLRVGLLTSRLKTAEKRQVLQGLADGSIDVVVGTQALLQKQVTFRRLVLSVTDEQHRFGVRQRIRLGGSQEEAEERAEDWTDYLAVPAEELEAHVLVMSATPIPRSLALIVYGDLELSILDELPAGRRPIISRRVSQEDAPEVLDFLRQELSSGAQAYVVCPSIRDSEGQAQLQSVESSYQRYRDEFFPDFRVGLLHGDMKEEEKQAQLEDFSQGKIQLLVCTTVVEVGVDCPNASVMLVKNAERFGLAQLHQLRGRVGRGQRQSYCFFESTAQEKLAQTRLETLCKSNDGFVLAEADLELRGPGDFFGTRQHGLPDLKLANLYSDRELVLASQQEVQKILAADPELSAPEQQALAADLERRFGSLLWRPGL